MNVDGRGAWGAVQAAFYGFLAQIFGLNEGEQSFGRRRSSVFFTSPLLGNLLWKVDRMVFGCIWSVL